MRPLILAYQQLMSKKILLQKKNKIYKMISKFYKQTVSEDLFYF